MAAEDEEGYGFVGGETHLFSASDSKAGLDVRESMGSDQDGLAFELLMQFSMSTPILREGSCIHEATCKESPISSMIKSNGFLKIK